MNQVFRFEIEKKIQGGLGRAGFLHTPHGLIKTPAFVSVGTKGTVKSLTPEQIKGALSQVVLANTYHLYLQPGDEFIKDSGGLHKFMNWDGPTMTDSGGFQAFSLGVAYGQGIGKFVDADAPETEILEEGLSGKNKKAKVTEDGVEFKSIIDGSTHFLSPEKSIQIQNNIGADIIFALDEFTSPHADFEKIKETIERTERWAERCLVENKKAEKNQKILPKFLGSPQQASARISSEHSDFFQQALFGIVQGGRYEELRKMSAEGISKLGFDGFGIGGTFIKEDMATAVRWVNEILPEQKPRHLLGVGEPLDLFLAVENGCDTFDCVAATRMARNGSLYTSFGKININNAKYSNSLSKIEETCNCYTCKNYTAGYLAHLFRAKEMLAATLATIHNLYFINSLVAQMREAILNDTLDKLKEDFFSKYKA